MIKNTTINNLIGMLNSGMSISLNSKEIEMTQLPHLLKAVKNGGGLLTLKVNNVVDLDVHNLQIIANSYGKYLKLDILD